MSCDPKSELTVLEARDVIESFTSIGSERYGVTVGDDGSIDELIDALPEQVEYDQEDEYDIVVVGNTDIRIVRT